MFLPLRSVTFVPEPVLYSFTALKWKYCEDTYHLDEFGVVVDDR
jgi:hypothetical protein